VERERVEIGRVLASHERLHSKYGPAGRVEREDQHSEVPIIHLIAARLIDRSDLLGQLARLGKGAEPVSDLRMMATRDFRWATRPQGRLATPRPDERSM
jgi:hypothetical protein